jgi:predicted ATPase/class 3 adenylate cyclase
MNDMTMNANLPTGTVTFLFTDIEGSTKLAQEHPDAMPALLAQHNEILAHSIQTHNGYIFEIVGDSFTAAFHSATDALNAAIDAQLSLFNTSWTPAPIKARMGIHTGTAQLNDASSSTVYTGYATLASTQRIMSAGHGGQILLSRVTRELVRDLLPSNTELLDLGEKRLKDLLRPEQLFQLNITGLPITFPPLKTLDSFPNNLPMQLTSFIGREHEIAELKQGLNEHRLVTLTGSGGTGKTRLSLQVAAELLEKFDHGVWFIELAPLADPDLIPQTILSAIDISEQPNKTPLEILKEYLREKKSLIVLDNCEHLVTASAQVVNALLNVAPNLKILASSREALGVKGELSYPVPSLTLPDVKHLPTMLQLSQYEAVRLFIDRALLVAPHFVVDKDNAPFIAQICYRLDGIPLAIELAAARIRMLSVEQISARLDDRFRLLTGGARTALPRQQTLRALIDWSYDILSENERLLLRRLSVFAGGWTLEAAEQVCSGAGIEVYDVLDLLSQLVNKSLVSVIEHLPGSDPRYRMLETIRQYAREKLMESRDIETLRQHHLAYFVKLAQQAEPELYHSDQLLWLDRLDAELDNLRMALEWALASDVESGLRIAVIPWRFWQARGYLVEIGEWLAQSLERYDSVNALHVQALTIYSSYFFRQGNFPEAVRLAAQSLQMARSLSNQQLEALSLSFLGVFTILEGNAEAGAPLLEQSLAIYRAIGDKMGQANALEWLSTSKGTMESAIGFCRESLQLYRELGHLAGITNSLTNLARLTLWRGDFSSPASWLEEALSISRQLGDQTSEDEILATFGILAYWQADYVRARAYFEESLILCEKVGDHFQALWAHLFMAYVILRQGDIPQAHEMFEDGIRNTQIAGLTIALVFSVEGLASLDIIQGKYQLSGQLFAWADSMREKIGDFRPPVEQASVDKDLAMIHSKVDDAEFTRLSAQGRSMTVEQAIALALEQTQV